jgi:hypothetical protein
VTAATSTQLTDEEQRLIATLGNTSRGFSGDVRFPGAVSAELAQRLIEKAYRRGVEQGATFMRRHLHPHEPGTGDWRRELRAPGRAYLNAVRLWRIDGDLQGFAVGDLPPRGPQ